MPLEPLPPCAICGGPMTTALGFGYCEPCANKRGEEAQRCNTVSIEFPKLKRALSDEITELARAVNRLAEAMEKGGMCGQG